MWQRLIIFIPLILVFLIPLAYSPITLEPDVILENNVTILRIATDSNINITQLFNLEDNYIRFDRWFNLTASGGKVSANLTALNSERLSFIINNQTLTDLIVWVSGSQPESIYLDEIEYSIGDNWIYENGIAKIDGTINTNITLTWLPAEVPVGQYSAPAAILVAVVIGFSAVIIIAFSRRR